MLSRYTVILLSCLCLCSCSSMFFFPQKQLIGTPDQINIDYEDVQFVSKDGTFISGWLIKTRQSRKGVVYFLHGNAENISTHLSSVYWLPEQGYDVLLLDYRGFGDSYGSPSLPEIFEDIEGGFFWLGRRYPDETNIYFLGQSIGASLGIYWIAHSPAAQTKIKKIILDAPFPSYPQMAAEVLQRSWLTCLFAKPVSWFFTSRYDAINALQNMPATTPVLFFHSPNDQVIPFAFSSEVFTQLPSPKTEIITEGRHIATFNYSENRITLSSFLSK